MANQSDSKFYVQQIDKTARKLQSSTSSDEQRQWARELQTLASQLATGGPTNRQGISVEAKVSSVQAASDIFTEMDRGTLPGIQEVRYTRQGDGTQKVRVTASEEAIPQASKVLSTMGKHFESSYSSSE